MHSALLWTDVPSSLYSHLPRLHLHLVLKWCLKISSCAPESIMHRQDVRQTTAYITKTTTTSCSDEVFPFNILVALCISFYTKDQMCPRPPLQVFWTNTSWACLGGRLYLYLVLSTCDPIVQVALETYWLMMSGQQTDVSCGQATSHGQTLD